MISSTIYTVRRLYQSKKRINRKLARRDIRFAFTSLFLDFIFLIFNFPIVLYLLLSNYISIDDETNDFLYISTSFFYYSNFGVIFYVNYFLNSLFREEFDSMCNMLKARLKSRNTANQNERLSLHRPTLPFFVQ